MMQIPASLRESDARSLIALILVTLLIAPARAQAPAGPTALNIEIVEGEGAINNTRLRTAREAIVEVQDENHKPIAGALVIFSAHGSNPFARGVLQATTNSSGRVSANPLQLKPTNGQLNIQVKASYQGHTAKITIHQTNSPTGNPGNSPSLTESVATTAVQATPVAAGLSVAAIAIIAAVAIGAALGGLAAGGVLGGGGKNAQISVGPPHF